MKRVSAVTLALLVGAAGCTDVVTSPQLAVDTETQFANASNPPPPPIDTGAVGRFRAGATLRAPENLPVLGPRFLIQQSLPQQPRTTLLGLPNRLANDIVIDAFNFNLPVKYDLSKNRDHGHVDFKKIKHSRAVKKTCHVNMDHGVFKGDGKLEIETEQGLLVIDCKSVNQDESYMEPCGDGVTPGERCFHLVFDDATLDGVEGSAETMAGCEPGNAEDEGCPQFPPEEID